MAQNVGPILEMVTERYLLRNEKEWLAREHAIGILDQILIAIRDGDIKELGDLRLKTLKPHYKQSFLGLPIVLPIISFSSVGILSLIISGVSGCWAACPVEAWASSLIPQ